MLSGALCFALALILMWANIIIGSINGGGHSRYSVGNMSLTRATAWGAGNCSGYVASVLQKVELWYLL